jgi:hypothetical protein
MATRCISTRDNGDYQANIPPEARATIPAMSMLPDSNQVGEERALTLASSSQPWYMGS